VLQKKDIKFSKRLTSNKEISDSKDHPSDGSMDEKELT